MTSWMRANRWGARFMDPKKRVRCAGGQLVTVWEVPTAAEQEQVIGRIASVTPVYRRLTGLLVTAGRYGGDTEWTAVADIFGRAILTYTARQRGVGADTKINLAVPTAGAARSDGGGGRRGQGRGEWHTVTVATALRMCLATRTSVSAAVHVNGNHWHALLPLQPDGSVRTVAARDSRWAEAPALSAAAAWVHGHGMA